MKKKMFINSLSGGIQLLISTILLLIAVPLFIHRLGIENYGVFSLVMIINSFSIFLGLGINSSLLKFISEQGKCRESNLDLFVAYVFLTLAYLPFLIIGIIFNTFFLNILGIPPQLITSDTIWLFNSLVAANFFLFIGQIPVTILDSLQKIYLTNLYQSIYQIIYWVFIIISIYVSASLMYIGLSILVSVIIWFVLVLISSKKYWGKITANFSRNEIKEAFKKQISYSYKIYLGSILNFFYEPLTKILISTFIGVTEVGYFDLILRIRTQIWNILIKLLYPLSPYISQLKDKIAVRNVIHEVEQKLTYVIIFLGTVIIFTGYDFVEVWLKTNEKELVWGMIIIISANLLAVIVIPVYQFLILKGYPEKTIILQSINVIVNLTIFYFLYERLGFFAVILANAAAILSSFVLCLYYQRKYLNSLIFDNLSQLFNAVKLLFLLLVSGYLIDLVISESLLELFILPAIVFVLTIFFIRILHIITREDIKKYTGESIFFRNLFTKIFLPAGRNVR